MSERQPGRRGNGDGHFGDRPSGDAPSERAAAATAAGPGGDEPRQPPAQPDRLAQPVDDEQPPRLPFVVVGIGASAGGLEAYIEFFESMPADSGMAFVLIQHLPPDRESMVADILSKRTGMPVFRIEDGMPVQPNNVYVIRPGHTITIRGGALHLGERLEGPANNRPVDDFFRSLAAEQRERAVAVVMSGMGSNGTAGAQAIKAVGGVCIAQDPESAEFPSMPRNLLDAGCADFVLRPADMPEVLRRYATHPYATGGRESHDDVLGRERQHFAEILGIVRARTRHEFAGYKKPTVLRRVQRRMGLNQVTRVEDYLRALRGSTTEAQALADDLMIHATGFFRDADAWESLRRNVIAPLIAGRDRGAPIRGWVTACSSGEEAYTLAILLVEAAEAANKEVDIKVFATDTGERSLARARAGVYPGGIETEISPGRLERFFERDESVYRVKRELRERVVFAPQNVQQDPPFSRLDICTCRNLLTYLEPATRRRALSLMHFGLREGGALFLGTGETVGGADDLFAAIDDEWRIYRRVGPTRHGAIDFPIPAPPPARDAGVARTGDAADARTVPRASLMHVAQRALLDRHTPAAVVVDRFLRIAYFHGDTAPFLAQPAGEPTRELLELARDPVRGAVRTALQQAMATPGVAGASARAAVTEAAGVRRRVVVTAAALDAKAAPGFYLVSFREHEEPAHVAPGPAGEGGDERDWRDEFTRLRDEHQSAIEELQTSNEELKASNEEVTSVNEELRSTNEEFETSREELQSLNEELTTVNSQLKTKMEELESSTNDLSSLLSSTDIAVVFLDTRLVIRRYTPAVRDLFELIPSDLGRPLSDLAMKFSDPELAADAGAVLERLIPIEREIRSESDRWYVRRALPYRTGDNRIDGVVITFVDVTALKGARAALSESAGLSQLVFGGIREYAILVLDLDNRITTWNDGARETFGHAPAEALGQKADIIFTPEDRAAGAVEQELATARAEGRAPDERWHLRKDGTRFWGSGVMSALADSAGRLRGYVKVLRDDTQRKRTEEAMQAAKLIAEVANEEKDQFLAMVSHELRTPLSAIILWVKLLREKPADPAQAAEGLEAIEQGAEAQRQLIDDLLDSTRIASGKLRLNVRRVDLAEVVRAAIETARPTAHLKELDLRVDVRPDVGHVTADPDRLQQVLWNLVANAMKFTPAGGRVDVAVRRAGPTIELVVADTGRGIEAGFLPRLFEKFTQADTGTARAQGGLGLGLAISLKLVEMHGGTIAADSAGPGEGATFTVRLPLPALPGPAREDRHGDEELAIAGVERPLDGVRVLLVEDDAGVRSAIARMLGHAGAAVTACGTGADGIAAVAAARPDVIVADIGMPEMDGYEMMRRVRAAEATAGTAAVPAVALTAFARDVDKRRALAVGFQRHVAKPPNPARFIAALAALAGRA